MKMYLCDRHSVCLALRLGNQSVDGHDVIPDLFRQRQMVSHDMFYIVQAAVMVAVTMVMALRAVMAVADMVMAFRFSMGVAGMVMAFRIFMDMMFMALYFRSVLPMAA